MTSVMAEAAAQLAAAAEKSWATSSGGGSTSGSISRSSSDSSTTTSGVKYGGSGEWMQGLSAASPQRGASPAASVSPSDPRLEALLKRQHQECPKILKELQQHRRKVRR